MLGLALKDKVPLVQKVEGVPSSWLHIYVPCAVLPTWHHPLPMESQGSGPTHPLSQPLRTAMGPTFQGLLWSLQRHREPRKLLSLCFFGCCFVCLVLISLSLREKSTENIQ